MNIWQMQKDMGILLNAALQGDELRKFNNLRCVSVQFRVDMWMMSCSLFESGLFYTYTDMRAL